MTGPLSTEEVVCMNGLSVNIHLLLISFYQPTETRYKIMIEDHAFTSDRVKISNLFGMLYRSIFGFSTPLFRNWNFTDIPKRMV